MFLIHTYLFVSLSVAFIHEQRGEHTEYKWRKLRIIYNSFRQNKTNGVRPYTILFLVNRIFSDCLEPTKGHNKLKHRIRMYISPFA